MPNLAKAALWYAAHGFPVFPLRSRAKTPITAHGFKNATTEREQITAWWKHEPDANIGLPMGAASHLLLLDLDFRNGGPEDRTEVVERFGQIPDTCEVITGSGGRHIYFRYDGGRVPKQIAAGVELKGDGGYAVAPPSIHPNGNEYTFDGMAGPKALLTVADPPPWLIAAIANGGAGKQKKATGAAEDQWPEGGRNNRLASLAGKLRRSGLSVQAITAALLEENRLRCKPPLSDSEVETIAASVGRYPAGDRPGFAGLHVNPHAAPQSIELLNSVALFEGRVQFAWVRRRGSMIQAGFANGREARWTTATDLRTFARSQDVLLDATGFLIPTPSCRAIKRTWEPVAQLIRTLADQDATNVEPPLKDEFEQIIRATWVRAERPEAIGKEAFFQILRECQSYRRDHAAAAPPRCCVWIGGAGEMSERYCWLYQDALLTWLSTPVAKSKHYAWEDVRTALSMLDFQQRELHRSLNGERVHVRVWQGPLDLLVDDDTVPETEL